MKQISQQSQTNPGGAFWHTRDGLIYIGPRQISAAGRWREIIASATVLAALAMMAVGLLAPQRLGLANNRIVYVAGPALVLAALIHLFLVISAVRGAWAVAGAGGLKLDGRKLSWSQVQRPRLEKSQAYRPCMSTKLRFYLCRAGPARASVASTPERAANKSAAFAGNISATRRSHHQTGQSRTPFWALKPNHTHCFRVAQLHYPEILSGKRSPQKRHRQTYQFYESSAFNYARSTTAVVIGE